MKSIFVALLLFGVSISKPKLNDEGGIECGDIQPLVECLRVREKQTGLVDDKSIVREERQLTFITTSGKTLELAPSSDAEPSDQRRFIVGTLDDGKYVLVWNQYYEGRDFSLIDMRTGEELYVLGFPLLSPDKLKLVAINKDLMAQYSPNVLDIWERDSETDRFRKSFELHPSDWAPGKVRWTSPDRVEFEKVSLESDHQANGSGDWWWRAEPSQLNLNEEWEVQFGTGPVHTESAFGPP